MGYYPNIDRYVWAFTNYYEIHVDSYMCNQDIKCMYLGFYYGCISNRIIALYK